MEIKGELMVDEENLIVTHCYKDDIDSSPGNTSTIIASFVTAYARLYLYSEMEKIEASRENRFFIATLTQLSLRSVQANIVQSWEITWGR